MCTQVKVGINGDKNLLQINDLQTHTLVWVFVEQLTSIESFAILIKLKQNGEAQ